MPAPYQLLNGPVDVYFADPVELPPDVATPAASIGGNWTIFGTAGDKDITEDGVKIMGEQDVNEFVGFGAIGTRKMFRSNQHVRIEFSLADISVEYLARAFNEATVNLDSHRRRMELLMDASVDQVSLLIRGDKSPYGEGWNSQWWFPRASHDSNIEVTYVKADPVMLHFRFTALVDDDYGFGFYEAQDEAS